MIVAGIDVGHLTTKILVLEDSQVLYAGLDTVAEKAEIRAQRAIGRFSSEKGLPTEDIAYIVATGAGGRAVSFAHKSIALPICLAKGAHRLLPSARTIVDVGAESSLVVSINDKGQPEEYTVQDKCASGSGIHVETIAQLLQMPLQEIATISLSAENRAEISATCAVFIAQEVISHLHREPPTPLAEIVAGVYAALAGRLAGMVKSVGLEPEVFLCGGLARNVGFVKILQEELGLKAFVPEQPQFVAALGAASIAGESI